MIENFIGQKVLIRSYASGVHFGLLKAFSEDRGGTYTVELADSRRIHYWEGAASLSQVACDGIKNGRVAMLLPKIVVAQAIEIIPMSDTAIDNLQNQKVWKM